MSVLITGGRSMEQIKDGYDFINSILKNEFMEIRKKKAKFLEDQPQQKPVVKEDVKKIKIKRANIKNYPSDDIIKQLMEQNLIPYTVLDLEENITIHNRLQM